MIADRIRAVREALNKTRKEFGEKIYVSQDVINNLERGRVNPTDLHIKALTETYNVNEHWLRTGEGEMFNPTTRSLDALADQHQIDDLTRAIVEGLIQMPKAHKDAFIGLIGNVANRIRSTHYERQTDAVFEELKHSTILSEAKAEELTENSSEAQAE